MAEALSQNQIDELLQRMRTGSVDDTTQEEKEQVKEYDFASPKKFTKEQMKSLNTLYENFARILSVYFTGILRSVVDVEVSQVEEQRYFEFNNSLPDSTMIAMIGFEQEGTNYDGSTLIMELPTTFGYLVVDRLMGGSEAMYAPDRDYTDIEVSLLNMVLGNVTKHMKEAWSTFFPLNTQLLSMETNGRLLQAYSQQDIVVIVSMEIKDESYNGMINICMPAENLEEVINSFSVKYSHGTRQQDPEKEQTKRSLMMGYLKQSDLTIEAILDNCQMNLNDVSSLQPGDVIALNKKISSDISVNIEGISWGSAKMGEVDQNKAIKIVEILEK